MKKSMLLLTLSILLLAAFPAIAADSPAEESAAVESAEQAAPAAEAAPEEQSLELFPGALASFLNEPQAAATCDPLQCFRSCRSSCLYGCFCSGTCVGDVCECTNYCYP